MYTFLSVYLHKGIITVFHPNREIIYTPLALRDNKYHLQSLSCSPQIHQQVSLHGTRQNLQVGCAMADI